MATITTPIKKVATIAMPPDFGIGLSWEDRSFGISNIRIREIIRRVITIDRITSEKAKARWVRNAERVTADSPFQGGAFPEPPPPSLQSNQTRA